MGSWDTILVILGSRGTPNGHLEVLISILLILGLIWETSWDLLWKHFRDFSMIWGSKMGDRFQVHVFGDPGMEMMSECNGCLC